MNVPNFQFEVEKELEEIEGDIEHGAVTSWNFYQCRILIIIAKILLKTLAHNVAEKQ